MKKKPFIILFAIFGAVLVIALFGGAWQTTSAHGTIPTFPPTCTAKPTKTMTVKPNKTPTKTKTPTPKKTFTKTPTKTATAKPYKTPTKTPRCYHWWGGWVCLP